MVFFLFLLSLVRTGDHKTPANMLGFNLSRNIKEGDKYGGPVFEAFGHKIGFLGTFFSLDLKWWYMVQCFKSPHNEDEEVLLSRHLMAKSWDGTEEVLGQCSLGTVLGRCILGTVPKKFWDSAVLGQFWDGAVLGQCSLGTVPKMFWDSAVLGQSWDGALLGQCSLGPS